MTQQELMETPERGSEIAATPVSQDPYIGMIERVCTDPNFDIDKMEKLMQMKEQHETKLAKQAYAEAMASCQTDMPSILKDAENSHTRSMYATLGSIQRAIKPIYARHGLSVTFGEGDAPKDGWVRTTCSVQHRGGHSETYHRDGPLDGAGLAGKTNKTEIQAIASTHTYNQRYLLCGAFAIAIVDDDHDGNAPLEYMAEAQVFELDEILSAIEGNDTGATGRFGKWITKSFGCDDIAACPSSAYPRIKSALQAKLKEVAG